MTKYRLKDADLQHHLDAISGGDFSECLKADLHFFDDRVTRIYFGGKINLADRFSVVLRREELKEIKEYNPNDWNDYPDTTPPEGVWMRVEAEIVNTDEIVRSCALFRDGRWHLTEQCTAVDLVEFAGTKKVKRYRPWE